MRLLRRPTLAAGAGWAAAALVATAAGLGGIRLVGESLTGTPGGVLSQEEVRRALTVSPASPSAAPSSASASSSSAATPARAATSPPPRSTGSATSVTPSPRTSRSPSAARPARSGPSPRPPATRAPQPRPSTRTTTPPPAPGAASFSTNGGTAVARCSGGLALLVSWSPRPGYQVDRVKQGPDHEVEVRFEGDEGRSELKISCGAGKPVAAVEDDDD